MCKKNKVINFKWYFLCLSCAFNILFLRGLTEKIIITKTEWIVCSSGEIFREFTVDYLKFNINNENSSSNNNRSIGSVRQLKEDEEGENEEENNNRVHLISWFRSVIDTQLMILYFHIGQRDAFFSFFPLRLWWSIEELPDTINYKHWSFQLDID